MNYEERCPHHSLMLNNSVSNVYMYIYEADIISCDAFYTLLILCGPEVISVGSDATWLCWYVLYRYILCSDMPFATTAISV